MLAKKLQKVIRSSNENNDYRNKITAYAAVVIMTPLLAYGLFNWVLFYSAGFIAVKANAFIYQKDQGKLILSAALCLLSIPFLLSGLPDDEKKEEENNGEKTEDSDSAKDEGE
jgi:hypothetical protein